MKKTLFECDHCKKLGRSIYEVKIIVVEKSLSNGEHAQPEAVKFFEVCDAVCASNDSANFFLKVMRSNEKEKVIDDQKRFRIVQARSQDS